MIRIDRPLALLELLVYVMIGIPAIVAATLLWWTFLPVVLSLRALIIYLWPKGKDAP
jgi:hypothetical protein